VVHPHPPVHARALRAGERGRAKPVLRGLKVGVPPPHVRVSAGGRSQGFEGSRLGVPPRTCLPAGEQCHSGDEPLLVASSLPMGRCAGRSGGPATGGLWQHWRPSHSRLPARKPFNPKTQYPETLPAPHPARRPRGKRRGQRPGQAPLGRPRGGPRGRARSSIRRRTCMRARPRPSGCALTDCGKVRAPSKKKTFPRMVIWRSLAAAQNTQLIAGGMEEGGEGRLVGALHQAAPSAPPPLHGP
jgi:hypothetical protein